MYRERFEQAAAACPMPSLPIRPDLWLDCREAVKWGLSEVEYIRRKRIWDAVMNEIPREQRADCMRAVIGKGIMRLDLCGG